MVIIRIECVKAHDENIRIVFVIALDVYPEIVRSSDLHSVTQVYVVSVCVLMRNDTKKAWIFRFISKQTH